VLELIKYYLPLFIQSVSQSLTYPLVAIVAANGAGGALNAAGLSQSNNVMWVISTIGGGILTGGLMYGRTRQNYRRFVHVNYTIMGINLVLLGLVSLPVFSHFVFSNIIGLSGQIETAAVDSFPWGIPLQALFYIRNPYQTVLLLNKRTGLSYLGTLGRIAVTVMLSPLFLGLHLVGPVWAMICLILPLIIEVAALMLFAQPYLRLQRQESDSAAPVSRMEIFMFILPISIGQILLNFSAFLIGASAARAPLAEDMLPAFFLANGLVSPIVNGAVYTRVLVIAFGQTRRATNTVLRFTAVSGLILCLIPLISLLPVIDHLYYVQLQKLPPGDLFLAHQSVLALLALPLLMSLRSFYEGKAALRKKPVLILYGHALYMGMVIAAAFLALILGMQGNLIGPLAVNLGNIFAVCMLMLGLYWDERKPSEAISVINPQR
jgi:hypothetical protein